MSYVKYIYTINNKINIFNPLKKINKIVKYLNNILSLSIKYNLNI